MAEPGDEVQELRRRLRQLAEEKSRLQLMADLMARLHTAPGLDDTVHSMLGLVAETIGGSNLAVYYRVDEALFRVDALGGKERLTEVDDPLVERVFATGALVEQEGDFGHTRMLAPAFTRAATWVFPLVVGDEVVGVLRIADLLLPSRELRPQLQVFLNYAALILKNEILGHTRLAVEVAERRRTEADLRQALADVARSNAELEQFAYVASHDLQEPLRMVTSYLQLLQRRYGDRLDVDAREFIGFAVDGACRMRQLILDLLTFSRVGTRAEPPARVACAEVLDEVLTILAPAVAEAGARVDLGPLPEVWADRGQLVQLFQNLVGNALKFRAEAPPVVRVSARRDGAEWVFSVADNGIGIEAEHQERIFQMFQRLHGADRYSGTGIGLALVKKIAERHGGKLWVESAPGQGATFSFTLPVAEPEEEP